MLFESQATPRERRREAMRGNKMNYWEAFWTFCLLVAGSTFAAITLIVIVKGGPDLREMLRQLRRQNQQR
jgi:hypothetical protein